MCLLCQGCRGFCEQQASVLRGETDSCVLCTSPQMHPGAPPDSVLLAFREMLPSAWGMQL